MHIYVHGVGYELANSLNPHISTLPTQDDVRDIYRCVQEDRDWCNVEY